MKKIYWKKLSLFEKIIYSLGWLHVISLIFWIAMITYNNTSQEEKFWNPGSKRVVFVFGWINFIFISFMILLSILGAAA